MTERYASRWRFLNTRFGNAFLNMATDEALLRRIEKGSSPPTIRVFGWTPPAVSFGYAQRVRHEVDLNRCRALGVDVVRRPSGGRAVLHWNELTYSVLCPANDPLLGGSVQEAYRRISCGLVAGLESLGVDAKLEPGRRPVPSPRAESLTSPCFTSTSQYEVTLGGKKLIGSAQRRMGEMLLQHGSLLLGPEHRRIVELMLGDSEARNRFQEKLDRHTTSLQEGCDSGLDYDAVAGGIRVGFAGVLEAELAEDALSCEERDEIHRLVCEKYSTDAWNFRDREREPSVIRRTL